MTKSHQIPRLQADPDGLDFDGLRRRGIELLQHLSNQQWTDYNYHDPGVTLLELLCYGLTDLVYRSDFDVADLLSQSNDVIDYHAQALYPPQEIFPNQALTDLDFCKLIYDRLPDVEDVWIRSHDAQETFGGLFSVFIKPHQSILLHSVDDAAQAHQNLRQKVFQLLSEQRNLCRDIADIHLVQPKLFTLAGEIEIDDSRPRAEVYADIYFRCAKLVSSGSQIVRFEEALRSGMTWEDILSGPLTCRGYIDASSFLDDSYDIDVVKLISLVRQIPGVNTVRSLMLVDLQGNLHEHLQFNHQDVHCPVLHFPKDARQVHALHLSHGRSLNLAGSRSDASAAQTAAQTALSHESQREVLAFNEQVHLYLKKYEFEYDAYRRNHIDMASVIPLPQGKYHQLAQYHSIGEETPAIYGINHYGVPKSEVPEVHARARQLKAYLYPFEQLMANYLVSLQQIRQVYSLNAQLDRSYFSQYLDDKAIPNIKELYNNRANPHEVAKILREQDHFEDRRNRVLDTMLAIYGEQFPDEDFDRYDYYHQGQSGPQRILGKIHLLKHLCELSSRRGAAINLQRAYSIDNQAMLQQRLRILTGSFDAENKTKPDTASLLANLQHSSKFISDTRYQALLHKQINVPTKIDPNQLSPIAKEATDNQDFSFTIPHGAICETLLKTGVCRDNYHALMSSEQHGWLCLRTGHDEYWPLRLLPKTEFSGFLDALIQELSALSLQTEGFHLLEHLLLRPRSASLQRDIDFDFYPHRVSIVLPGFTARFADLKCRLWIEDLISQHLPAHIMADFCWLDFAFFAQFELRYLEWMTQLRLYSESANQADSSALDTAATAVITCMKTHRHAQTTRRWI